MASIAKKTPSRTKKLHSKRAASRHNVRSRRFGDRLMRRLHIGILVLLAVCLVSVPLIAKSSAADEVATTASTGGTSEITCNTAGIQKLVASVSEKNIKENLQALVQDDSKPTPNALISRHVSSPGNQLKVDWAKQKLEDYGLEIVEQPFTQGKYKLENLIGRVEGTNPNVLYAAGAHIDSINGDSNNSKKPAPGGNDDGSGTVAAMEAGRVLKAFQPCMKSSIDFIGFNYEESDQEWGSDYYVKQLRKDKKTFKGLYNMDMIGYAPGKECINSYYNKRSRDRPMANRLKTVNTKYKIGLQVKVASYSDEDHSIDSSNFWEEKLPSAYIYECNDDDPGYHKPTDTLKNINYKQITKTTKLVVAALAELSMKK